MHTGLLAISAAYGVPPGQFQQCMLSTLSSKVWPAVACGSSLRAGTAELLVWNSSY
jgi:hypothetical protein